MIDVALEQELMRERALGVAPALNLIDPGADLGRDVAFVDQGNGLDLAMVKGFDNLTQSLAVALTTRLGDDVFNTTFGFDGLNAIAEETNPVMQRERIRISVIVVLKKDPRVRRIVDVALVDGRLDQPTPGSRDLSVVVAFEAVSGDSVNLDLGKVATNGSV
jgi:phage baseplate assembly protein W